MESSGIIGVILVIVLFILMYFLMMKPQKERQARHAKIIKNLKKGDRIVTLGGVCGVVDDIDRQANTVTVDCDGIYLMFDIRAVNKILKKNSKGGKQN